MNGVNDMRCAGLWTGSLQGRGNTAHVMALVVASMCCATQQAHAYSMPDTTVPNTFAIKGWWHVGSGKDWARLGEAGARFVNRTGGPWYWNQVEKSKGSYSFGTCDSILSRAEKSGFTMIACLFGGNKLYENPKPGGIRTAAGRKGFANWAAALAGRYRGRRIIFEIWNEPNIRGFWGNHGKANSNEYADEYAALVNEVAPAMIKADPDCFIMAGSISCMWSASFRWTERCFERGVLKSGIRAWSCHPYGFIRPELCIDRGYAPLRKLLAKYSAPRDFLVLDSEVGYPLGEWLERGGSPKMRKKEDRETHLDHQAWLCVRQYLVDMMCDVPLSVWYQWRTKEWGIVNEDTSPRPTFTARATLARELYGYRFVERVGTRSARDYLLLFENKKGKRKLVAWSEYPRGKYSPDSPTSHSLQVPVATNAPALTVCDVFGKRAELPVMSGTIVIDVRGGPQYIALGGGGGRRSTFTKFTPAAVERRTPTEVGTAMFDELLKGRIAEEVADGRSPSFFSPSARAKLEVTAIDENGQLGVRASRTGVELSIPWSNLSFAERSSLAVSSMREGDETDNAIAAFYLLAIDEVEQARDCLEAAGALAEEVSLAFE